MANTLHNVSGKRNEDRNGNWKFTTTAGLRVVPKGERRNVFKGTTSEGDDTNIV